MPSRFQERDLDFVAGNDFAGIDLAIGIESLFDAGEEGASGVVEEIGHEVEFFYADAMLAGDGAADIDAELQDFFRGSQCILNLVLVPIIVEKDGVNVAIASVEDVGDLQTVLTADFANALQHFRQFAAWNAGVLRAIAVTDSADGAEGIFAGSPEVGAAI